MTRRSRTAAISFGAILLVGLLAAPGPLGAMRVVPDEGRFLVASRGMRDPRFARTVVLLVSHDENGTMGLVINKRTEIPLDEALPGIAWREGGPRFVNLGGPVLTEGMSFLLRAESAPGPAREIVEGVYHSASLALLTEAAGMKDAASRLRVFAGHAGWAPGQLDAELTRGDWHVLNGGAEDIFHEPPSEIWTEMIQRAEAEWVRLPGGTRSALRAPVEISSRARMTRIRTTLGRTLTGLSQPPASSMLP